MILGHRGMMEIVFSLCPLLETDEDETWTRRSEQNYMDAQELSLLNCINPASSFLYFSTFSSYADLHFFFTYIKEYYSYLDF